MLRLNPTCCAICTVSFSHVDQPERLPRADSPSGMAGWCSAAGPAACCAQVNVKGEMGGNLGSACKKRLRSTLVPTIVAFPPELSQRTTRATLISVSARGAVEPGGGRLAYRGRIRWRRNTGRGELPSGEAPAAATALPSDSETPMGACRGGRRVSGGKRGDRADRGGIRRPLSWSRGRTTGSRTAAMTKGTIRSFAVAVPPRCHLTDLHLSCAGKQHMCKRRSRLHSPKTPVTASNAC